MRRVFPCNVLDVWKISVIFRETGWLIFDSNHVRVTQLWFSRSSARFTGLRSEQHDFISWRSCITNLAVFLQSAWEAISDGCQTDAIYTDYLAVFQNVNHSLLIHKLKHSYKLEEFAMKWFFSYLSDRCQRAIVKEKTSKWTALSGVPERSLLARDAEPEPEPPEPTHFGRSRSRSGSRRNGLLGAGAGAVKNGRLRLRKGKKLWKNNGMLSAK